ncbi:MAG: hypothetical protein WB689_37165, partial [Xanthobacteraceae bacterium]
FQTDPLEPPGPRWPTSTFLSGGSPVHQFFHPYARAKRGREVSAARSTFSAANSDILELGITHGREFLIGSAACGKPRQFCCRAF